MRAIVHDRYGPPGVLVAQQLERPRPRAGEPGRGAHPRRPLCRAPGRGATRADPEAVAALVASGGVRPVIERTYPLDEVPDAIRRFEAGHTRGKIVIVPPA